MTQRELESFFLQRLKTTYDSSEAQAITRLVFEEMLGQTPENRLFVSEKIVSSKLLPKFNELAKRLENGEPLQYILGISWFHGLKLKVNPSVLIPRPETEELVSLIVELGKSKFKNILDVGTGSGCIALAIKKYFPDANVIGIDISEEALRLARHNAAENQLNVNFYQKDILNVLLPDNLKQLLKDTDLIVSNPPYIPISEKNTLHSNVTDFEPHLALFVPDDDPLIFYKAIADLAKTFLIHNGFVYLETHHSLSQSVGKLFKDKGFFNIKVLNDLSGNARFVKACN